MNFFKNNYISKLNSIFLSDQSAASKYLLNSIKSQRKNLFINIFSGILTSILEGFTLSFVYIIVKIVSDTENNFKISSIFLFRPFSFLHNWLNSLEFKQIFIFLIILALLTQITQSFCKYINLLSARYIEAKCISMVTREIFERIFSFSYRCSSKFKVGDLSELIVQSPETIRYQIEQLNQIILGIVLAFTYCLVLVFLSPWLFLGVIVIAYFTRMLQRKISPRIKNISSDITKTKVEISKTVVECFQGIRVIYSFGLVNYILDNLYLKTNFLDKRLRDRARKITIIEPVLSCLPILFASIISLVLVFSVERTSIFALLGTFVIAIQRLNFRFIGISNSLTNLSDNIPKISRLNYIFSDEDKEFRRTNGKIIPNKIKKLTFHNVSFAYSEDKKFSITKLNFTLKKGEITAIVGPSGAGKSSILDLLIGLFEPNSGQILVDGNALCEIDLNSWQKKISIVSQDIFLFNASILKNLSFGLSKVDPQQILRACKESGAHQFISNLPKGYETLIGERGFKLSGGQRQRLAIARALLRKSEICIFDEATSSLDSITELSIQRNLYNFKKEKITLLVAHRLSTVKNADKILVVENGKILGSGSHEQLLENNNLYNKLWEIQKK